MCGPLVVFLGLEPADDGEDLVQEPAGATQGVRISLGVLTPGFSLGETGILTRRQGVWRPSRAAFH